MSRLYYVLHLILNIRHFDTGLHGETCHMYPVAQIIGLFHGCVRQCYCFRSLSLNIHVALGRAHTHHLIVNTVYPDILSTRVFSRVKQTFIHTFTYCADFTCSTSLMKRPYAISWCSICSYSGYNPFTLHSYFLSPCTAVLPQ